MVSERLHAESISSSSGRRWKLVDVIRSRLVTIPEVPMSVRRVKSALGVIYVFDDSGMRLFVGYEVAAVFLLQ